MEPMTVAALRQILADLPGDQVVIDAATGRALDDVDTDFPGQVALLFAARPRRQSAKNVFVGEIHGGSLMQVGGDYHGNLHL
ncbi:hypothetical protein UIS43_27985 (plasmid) [Nocardiopsis sp. LDBS0036]|uniref:hypothetical protein n=1 Tax=Nocardiopsis sp. LDBS0036 TaxID=3104276 RepID=UPI0035113981